MPRITNELVINADPDTVYRVGRDVERFPEFMPDVKSVTVKERSEDGRRLVVEWVGYMPEFKLTVRWTEEDIWDDAARTCTFSFVSGDFKEYGGEWRFEPAEGGTRFVSVVDYEIEIPLVGPLIKSVIKRKMSENVDKLQLALKRHIESAT